MTIKELKQKIENLPDNMEVWIDERQTDFRYGYAHNAEVRNIGMQEEPGSKILASEECFVIFEE